MDYNHVEDIILYPTALCNLKCSYCYITKSNALKLVDDSLKKSFKGNYYIKFIKEVLGNNLENIRRVEFWGAEVALHIDRTFGVLEDIIEACPNFNEVMFSTNCTHEELFKSIKGLIALFSKYKHRRFVIDVQISIDGPAEITDPGRGKGVTKKIIENLNYMAKEHFFLGDTTNVQIAPMFKSTLTAANLPKFLNRNYIIDYYKFFEDKCYQPLIDECYGDFRMFLPNDLILPGFAEPYPFTQEDGLLLADVCKLMRDMEKEGLSDMGLKYYKNITFFHRELSAGQITAIENADISMPGTFCGPCFRRIGFLPDKKLSGCVRTFSEYLESYNYDDSPLYDCKQKRTSNLLFDSLKECDIYAEMMDYIHDQEAIRRGANPSIVMFSAMIQMLAKANLIDNRLVRKDLANRAAVMIGFFIPNCASDSLSITGSTILPYAGKFKFFLNGAYKYIYQGINHSNGGNEKGEQRTISERI